MNVSRFSHRQPNRNMRASSHRVSIQLLPEPTPKGKKNDTFESGFTLNITNMPRRQPRKSLLGTRRTTRESLLPLSEMITVEETPTISLRQNDRVSNAASPKPDSSPQTIFETLNSRSTVLSPNAEYNPLTSPSQRDIFPSLSSVPTDSSFKNEISPCKRRLETIFSQGSIDDSFEKNETVVKADVNEESVLATTLTDNTIIEKSPTLNEVPARVLSPPTINFNSPKCRLEPILSQETNDSFEEHETMLNADKDEESVLATTLVDESLVPNMDDTQIRFCDSTMVGDKTVNRVETNESNDEQNKLLVDWLQMLNDMISTKNQEAAKLQTQLDEVNRQKEEYETMKRRVTSVFKFAKPAEEETELCKASDDRLNVQTAKSFAKATKTIKVDETIKDLQSTLKFLKTPRVSRLSRSSILLTPHSMSFSVKAQFEKLME